MFVRHACRRSSSMSSSLLLDAAELKFVRVLGGHADGGGNADLSIMPDQLSDGDTIYALFGENGIDDSHPRGLFTARVP